MTEPLPPAGPPRRERREEVVEERVWYQEPVWIVAILAFVVLLVLFVVLLNLMRATDEPDTVVLDPDVEVEVDDPGEPAPATPEEEVVVEVTPTPTPTPSPAFTPAPGDVEEDTPEPIQVSGSGDGTVAVEHEGGLAMLRMRHEGESFTLHVVDTDGEPVEDFEVSATGQYEGSRGLGLPAGDYELVISADGAWAVSFEQPRYVAGQSLPLSIEGRHDKATEPFQTDGGQIRFAWEAEEPAALLFRILDADGEVVATDLGGPGLDEESVELDAGLYLLDVQGVDVWRIEIS
jgi:hypothetical protein